MSLYLTLVFSASSPSAFGEGDGDGRPLLLQRAVAEPDRDRAGHQRDQPDDRDAAPRRDLDLGHVVHVRLSTAGCRAWLVSCLSQINLGTERHRGGHGGDNHRGEPRPLSLDPALLLGCHLYLRGDLVSSTPRIEFAASQFAQTLIRHLVAFDHRPKVGGPGAEAEHALAGAAL